jgi:hypothetical protein
MNYKLRKYFNKFKTISKNFWLILTGILIITFMFYWQQIRPVIAKKNCYKDSVIKAIKIFREEKLKPFLYDREHWKDYKKPNTSNSFWAILGSEKTKPAFEENIKTNTEPLYIQENLDQINQKDTFYDEDYLKYYKQCLQSKGL